MELELKQQAYAPIAEKSLLCGMIRDSSRIAVLAADGVNADMFYMPSHRAIYGMLVTARDNGRLTDGGEIDWVTMCQDAALDGTIEKIGGPFAIAEIATYAPTLAGWSAWVDQLRETKARRIASEAGDLISGAADSEEAISSTKRVLERLQTAITAKTRAIKADKACNKFIENFVSVSENKGQIPGISTGIEEIDFVTGGAKPGELWTIAGPSSSGKSALMYQIASSFLVNQKTLAIFSAELMDREIIGRLICLLANVPYSVITSQQECKKHELEKIQRAIQQTKPANLWIDASSGQSLDSITAESGRIRDMAGSVDLIVVDYIQLIKGVRNKGDSREQEVASISGGLKQLAKEYACPVITGSQLNDAGKTRESRAIEQDSDVLITIDGNKLVMTKNRNGQRNGTVNLALDGTRQRFCRYVTE